MVYKAAKDRRESKSPHDQCDAGRSGGDLKVSPKMVEAGVSVLIAHPGALDLVGDHDVIVTAIFSKLWRVAQTERIR